MTRFLQWLDLHDGAVTAGASIALAAFAIVQIGLEAHRSFQLRREAKIAMKAPAWLVRRSLEEVLRFAEEEGRVEPWARAVGASARLDPMEARMREVVELGSRAGGDPLRAGDMAFSAFLAYANSINELAEMVERPGYPDPSKRKIAFRLRVDAVRHLKEAIALLETVAPRVGHERPVPDVNPPLLPQGGHWS